MFRSNGFQFAVSLLPDHRDFPVFEIQTNFRTNGIENGDDEYKENS